MLSTVCLAAIAVLVTGASAADSCGTAPFASCGSNAGTTCCPSGYYCQPWNAAFFQCMATPAQCSQQLTNTDFYGDDIKTIYGIQPADCCAQCANTAGCTAYTFVNSNPGSPACYLKKGSGDRRALVGAVSGIVGTGGSTPPSPPTPPPTTCITAAFGNCGSSSGTSCCSNGQYCQPWSVNYYQCMAPPAQCSRQLTDMDYYGNDIKTVYVSLPTLCCEECAKTAGCKAYTYINSNPGQPVCYLKSAAGTPTRLVGGVAGQLN